MSQANDDFNYLTFKLFHIDQVVRNDQ